MKKLIELITGDDNVTLEPAYALGTLAFLVGIGLQIYSVITQHPFDIQNYGLGIGIFLAGMGAGKWAGTRT